MYKPKVAFICVHNSCRSQIAEALGKRFAGDIFQSCSAGINLRDYINLDAVRLVKALYGIDMTKTQRPKLLAELPPNLDIIITMGCNVDCPFIPCKHREDWGLTDPSGRGDAAFTDLIKTVENKIIILRESIVLGNHLSDRAFSSGIRPNFNLEY